MYPKIKDVLLYNYITIITLQKIDINALISPNL